MPNLPDIGATPAFRAQGALAQATGTALSSQYNTGLYAALETAGLRFIPLDTFTLLREVLANPGLYGFTNFTGTACQPQITANSLTCNPSSLITPTAARDYVFADGVHPTTATHLLTAQYAISVLEAPRLIQQLGRTGLSSMSSTATSTGFAGGRTAGSTSSRTVTSTIADRQRCSGSTMRWAT